jgi:hypothetical protein
MGFSGISPSWVSVLGVPTLPEMEQARRDRLDAFPPAARAELLHVLMLPDFERDPRCPLGTKAMKRPGDSSTRSV